jgi:spore coat polysaccharide biosynthesis protein SpsF (cytidylyltransferase family)
MKIVTIIQARLSSTRLPGKVLMTLVDKPVIEWVYERAARIPGTNEVVVATTATAADDALARWCERRGWSVFRGSEDDVLDRYVQCARRHDADAVVRVTADCPLLDPIQSGRVVALFLERQPCHYASNCEPPTFPDGLDTEIISREALELSWEATADAFDREHVTPYVRSGRRFATEVVTCEPPLSEHRWTLDELRDFTFLSAVAERLRANNLDGSMQEVLEILRAEPELSALNSGIERNAGARRVARAS